MGCSYVSTTTVCTVKMMAIGVEIQFCLPFDHKGEVGDFSPKRNSLYSSLRYLIILLCFRVSAQLKHIKRDQATFISEKQLK